MSETFYSAQTIGGSNPLRPAGFANLGLGALKLACAVVLLLGYPRELRALLSGDIVRNLVPVISVAAYTVIALVLLALALKQMVRGIGQTGRLIVPPRAPADFPSYEADLAIPLQRREMPAYRLPETEEYVLAHRLFPQRFPMLNQRQRQVLGTAVSSVSSTVWLAVGLSVLFWGFGLMPSVLATSMVPPFPLVPLLAITAGAAARVLFVILNLPSGAPTADRGEFRLALAGGGDPKQIPIGLEHELMAFRPDTGAPNRGLVTGFDMTTSGVQDAGKYVGSVIVETQPEMLSAGAARYLPLLFVPAVLLTGLGLLTLYRYPGYLNGLSLVGSSDPLTVALSLVRWVGRLGGAYLLLATASAALAEAERYLSVFVFASTAVAVNVQGTFGRAGIKVGKSIHDSIESENVVVRSDSSIVGFAARVQSESIGLMGTRSILSMQDGGAGGEVRHIVEDWFKHFQARGADIVGVDLRSDKVADLVRANISIDANRAAARRSVAPAQLESSFPVHWAIGNPNESAMLLPAGTDEAATASGYGATQLAGDEQNCPECAETIKAAAKKCRFCGYRFDQGN
jgi:hypothetical protein